jgi:hypothetical protein
MIRVEESLTNAPFLIKYTTTLGLLFETLSYVPEV